MESVLNDLMREPDVRGAMCTDKSGMCVLAKGDVQSKYAGVLSAVTELCESIDVDQPSPSICIETDKRRVLCKRDGDTTVVIFKDPAAAAGEKVPSDA